MYYSVKSLIVPGGHPGARSSGAESARTYCRLIADLFAPPCYNDRGNTEYCTDWVNVIVFCRCLV